MVAGAEDMVGLKEVLVVGMVDKELTRSFKGGLRGTS